MKQIHHFPDLQKDISYNLSLDHFNQGLDPNSIDTSGTRSFWFNCYNENIALQNPHILQVLLHYNLYQKGIIDFIADTLILLKNKIEQKHINDLSFYCISLIDNNEHIKILNTLKDNGMLDINANIGGYNMLACTKNKSKIEWLIENGCDIHHKMSNPESPNYGKTVYDMALESKKKGWIDYLKPHLPQELVNEDSQVKLDIFRQEKKPAKQLKLYLAALKEKNYSIVDDIINNQKNYQELISFEDGIGKNLIRYAVGHNSNDVLEKIIKLDYYQNNKTAINKHNRCYTTDAVELGKNASAKILYINGFKNDNSLINAYEKSYLGNNDTLTLMVNDGYKPTLKTRLNNFCYHNLETLNKDQIQNFFKEHSYLLNLKISSGAKNTFYAKATINSYVNIKDGSFKLISLILAQQEKIDPQNFEQNFYKIMGGIGQNKKEFALRFGSILLENFPSKNMIDCLGYYSQPAWLTELSYEQLNIDLEKINYEDSPTIRKMKI